MKNMNRPRFAADGMKVAMAYEGDRLAENFNYLILKDT